MMFGIYLAALLLSAILSENPLFSLPRFLGEIYLIGLAVLASTIVTSRQMAKKVVIVWLCASIISAAIGSLTVIFFYSGISNFLTELAVHHYGSLPPGNYVRLQGTYLFPSMLCNYLTVSLLMMLAARKLGWLGRTTFVVGMILIAITIAFTVTPGIGGVLLAVSLWFWFFQKDNRRPKSAAITLSVGVITAAAFILVSAFTLIPTQTSPYFYTVGGIRVDPTQRLLAWQDSIQTFGANPIFGRGLGLGTAEVKFMAPSGDMQIITDAHNTFLNVAGQAGVLGVIPLVAICFMVIRRFRYFSFDGSERSVIRRALAIAFISAFIFQGLVGSFENTRHLWVLIGLILAFSREQDLKNNPAN